jgi:hypothetical protein
MLYGWLPESPVRDRFESAAWAPSKHGGICCASRRDERSLHRPSDRRLILGLPHRPKSIAELRIIGFVHAALL